MVSSWMLCQLSHKKVSIKLLSLKHFFSASIAPASFVSLLVGQTRRLCKMGVTSSITSPTVYSSRRPWLLWAMFVALRIFPLSLCQNPDMWFAGGSWKPYFSNTHRDPIRTHMSVAQSRCVLHSRVWMGLTDNWQMAEILTDWQAAYNLTDN